MENQPIGSGYPSQSYTHPPPPYGATERPPPLPQQYGPPPGQHQPQPQVYHVTTRGAPILAGPYPYQTVCSACGNQIVTETRPIPGNITWLTAGLTALVGCIFGCCLIPFCVPGLQDVEHCCPRCKSYIMTYRRF